jgi:hypothetical protein
MEKNSKNRFWNLKKWEMKKIEICHKNLKIFILKWKFPFEIGKNGHITRGKCKQNWNEKSIYFVYATEIEI